MQEKYKTANSYQRSFDLFLYIFTSDTYRLHPKTGKEANISEIIQMKNIILFALNIETRNY